MAESVLIAGGMGYLGGRIALKLIEQKKFDVRITTNKVKAVLPKRVEKSRLIPFDILFDSDVTVACQGIESIIHLVALNEVESQLNPEQAFMVNSLGTLKLLQAAEKAGVKKFIYFSTIHVYGKPLVGKITELNLPRPTHPYAITHRAAEDFVLSAHDRRALCGVVLRLSNAFGAPADPDVNAWTLVMNDLCRQAVTNRKIELRSSGLQSRDFITIEDVVRAVLHFLDLPATECGGGLFNLGGENPIRIIDLAELIALRCAKTLGFRPQIVRPEPKPEETCKPLQYSIDKLKNTGFTLKGNLDREIDETLKFCQSFVTSLD